MDKSNEAIIRNIVVQLTSAIQRQFTEQQKIQSLMSNLNSLLDQTFGIEQTKELLNSLTSNEDPGFQPRCLVLAIKVTLIRKKLQVKKVKYAFNLIRCLYRDFKRESTIYGNSLSISRPISLFNNSPENKTKFVDIFDASPGKSMDCLFKDLSQSAIHIPKLKQRNKDIGEAWKIQKEKAMKGRFLMFWHQKMLAKKFKNLASLNNCNKIFKKCMGKHFNNFLQSGTRRARSLSSLSRVVKRANKRKFQSPFNFWKRNNDKLSLKRSFDSFNFASPLISPIYSLESLPKTWISPQNPNKEELKEAPKIQESPSKTNNFAYYKYRTVKPNKAKTEESESLVNKGMNKPNINVSFEYDPEKVKPNEPANSRQIEDSPRRLQLSNKPMIHELPKSGICSPNLLSVEATPRFNIKNEEFKNQNPKNPEDIIGAVENSILSKINQLDQIDSLRQSIEGDFNFTEESSDINPELRSPTNDPVKDPLKFPKNKNQPSSQRYGEDEINIEENFFDIEPDSYSSSDKVESNEMMNKDQPKIEARQDMKGPQKLHEKGDSERNVSDSPKESANEDVKPIEHSKRAVNPKIDIISDKPDIKEEVENLERQVPKMRRPIMTPYKKEKALFSENPAIKDEILIEIPKNDLGKIISDVMLKEDEYSSDPQSNKKENDLPNQLSENKPNFDEIPKINQEKVCSDIEYEGDECNSDPHIDENWNDSLYQLPENEQNFDGIPEKNLDMMCSDIEYEEEEEKEKEKEDEKEKEEKEKEKEEKEKEKEEKEKEEKEKEEEEEEEEKKEKEKIEEEEEEKYNSKPLINETGYHSSKQSPENKSNFDGIPEKNLEMMCPDIECEEEEEGKCNSKPLINDMGYHSSKQSPENKSNFDGILKKNLEMICPDIDCEEKCNSKPLINDTGYHSSKQSPENKSNFDGIPDKKLEMICPDIECEEEEEKCNSEPLINDTGYHSSKQSPENKSNFDGTPEKNLEMICPDIECEDEEEQCNSKPLINDTGYHSSKQSPENKSNFDEISEKSGPSLKHEEDKYSSDPRINEKRSCSPKKLLNNDPNFDEIPIINQDVTSKSPKKPEKRIKLRSKRPQEDIKYDPVKLEQEDYADTQEVKVNNLGQSVKQDKIQPIGIEIQSENRISGFDLNERPILEQDFSKRISKSSKKALRSAPDKNKTIEGEQWKEEITNKQSNPIENLINKYEETKKPSDSSSIEEKEDQSESSNQEHEKYLPEKKLASIENLPGTQLSKGEEHLPLVQAEAIDQNPFEAAQKLSSEDSLKELSFGASINEPSAKKTRNLSRIPKISLQLLEDSNQPEIQSSPRDPDYNAPLHSQSDPRSLPSTAENTKRSPRDPLTPKSKIPVRKQVRSRTATQRSSNVLNSPREEKSAEKVASPQLNKSYVQIFENKKEYYQEKQNKARWSKEHYSKSKSLGYLHKESMNNPETPLRSDRRSSIFIEERKKDDTKDKNDNELVMPEFSDSPKKIAEKRRRSKSDLYIPSDIQSKEFLNQAEVPGRANISNPTKLRRDNLSGSIKSENPTFSSPIKSGRDHLTGSTKSEKVRFASPIKSEGDTFSGFIKPGTTDHPALVSEEEKSNIKNKDQRNPFIKNQSSGKAKKKISKEIFEKEKEIKNSPILSDPFETNKQIEEDTPIPISEKEISIFAETSVNSPGEKNTQRESLSYKDKGKKRKPRDSSITPLKDETKTSSNPLASKEGNVDKPISSQDNKVNLSNKQKTSNDPLVSFKKEENKVQVNQLAPAQQGKTITQPDSQISVLNEELSIPTVLSAYEPNKETQSTKNPLTFPQKREVSAPTDPFAYLSGKESKKPSIDTKNQGNLIKDWKEKSEAPTDPSMSIPKVDAFTIDLINDEEAPYQAQGRGNKKADPFINKEKVEGKPTADALNKEREEGQAADSFLESSEKEKTNKDSLDYKPVEEEKEEQTANSFLECSEEEKTDKDSLDYKPIEEEKKEEQTADSFLESSEEEKTNKDSLDYKPDSFLESSEEEKTDKYSLDYKPIEEKKEEQTADSFLESSEEEKTNKNSLDYKPVEEEKEEQTADSFLESSEKEKTNKDSLDYKPIEEKKEEQTADSFLESSEEEKTDKDSLDYKPVEEEKEEQTADSFLESSEKEKTDKDSLDYMPIEEKKEEQTADSFLESSEEEKTDKDSLDYKPVEEEKEEQTADSFLECSEEEKTDKDSLDYKPVEEEKEEQTADSFLESSEEEKTNKNSLDYKPVEEEKEEQTSDSFLESSEEEKTDKDSLDYKPVEEEKEEQIVDSFLESSEEEKTDKDSLDYKPVEGKKIPESHYYPQNEENIMPGCPLYIPEKKKSLIDVYSNQDPKTKGDKSLPEEYLVHKPKVENKLPKDFSKPKNDKKNSKSIKKQKDEKIPDKYNEEQRDESTAPEGRKELKNLKSLSEDIEDPIEESDTFEEVEPIDENCTFEDSEERKIITVNPIEEIRKTKGTMPSSKPIEDVAKPSKIINEMESDRKPRADNKLTESIVKPAEKLKTTKNKVKKPKEDITKTKKEIYQAKTITKPEDDNKLTEDIQKPSKNINLAKDDPDQKGKRRQMDAQVNLPEDINKISANPKIKSKSTETLTSSSKTANENSKANEETKLSEALMDSEEGTNEEDSGSAKLYDKRKFAKATISPQEDINVTKEIKKPEEASKLTEDKMNQSKGTEIEKETQKPKKENKSTEPIAYSKDFINSTTKSIQRPKEESKSPEAIIDSRKNANVKAEKSEESTPTKDIDDPIEVIKEAVKESAKPKEESLATERKIIPKEDDKRVKHIAKSMEESKSTERIVIPREDFNVSKDTAKLVKESKPTEAIMNSRENAQVDEDRAEPKEEDKSVETITNPRENIQKINYTSKPKEENKSNMAKINSREDIKRAQDSPKSENKSKSTKAIINPTEDIESDEDITKTNFENKWGEPAIDPEIDRDSLKPKEINQSAEFIAESNKGIKQIKKNPSRTIMKQRDDIKIFGDRAKPKEEGKWTDTMIYPNSGLNYPQEDSDLSNADEPQRKNKATKGTSKPIEKLEINKDITKPVEEVKTGYDIIETSDGKKPKEATIMTLVEIKKISSIPSVKEEFGINEDITSPEEGMEMPKETTKPLKDFDIKRDSTEPIEENKAAQNIENLSEFAEGVSIKTTKDIEKPVEELGINKYNAKPIGETKPKRDKVKQKEENQAAKDIAKPVEEFNITKYIRKPTEEIETAKEIAKPIKGLGANKYNAKPIEEIGTANDIAKPVEGLEISNYIPKPIEEIDASKDKAKQTKEFGIKKYAARPIEEIKASKDIEKPIEEFGINKDITKLTEENDKSKVIANPNKLLRIKKDSSAPIEEIKPQKNIAQPREETKASRDTEKPTEFGLNKSIASPEGEIETVKDITKPQEEFRVNKDATKPMEEIRAVNNFAEISEEKKVAERADKPNIAAEDIKEPVDEIKEAERIKKQLDEIKAAERIKKPLDETKAAERIKKPLDETKAAGEIKKPLDEIKAAEGNKKPLDKIKAAETIRKPLDESKAAKGIKKPLDEIKAAEEIEKPLDEIKAAEEIKKPLDETKATKGIKKPLDEIKTAKRIKKPLDEIKAAEEIKKPLHEGKAAERVKKPLDETKAAKGSKKPLDETKAAEEIKKPLDEIKAAEEIKEPVDKIKAAERIKKPLDETKAAERIKKPLDEIKAAEGNTKSSDEIKAAEEIKKPLDEMKAAKEIKKPLDEIKAAEEIKKPLDETKAVEEIKKPLDEIKAAEEIKKPLDEIKAAETIRKPLDEAKAAERIKKPLDEIKAAERIKKPFDEIKGSERIKKPLDETKAAEEIKKPLDEIKAAEGIKKPLDETKTAETIRKPLDEIKAAEEIKKPLDEMKAAKEIKKPLDETKAAKRIKKPLDETKAAERIKKPLDETKAAEEIKKPLDEIKAAEEIIKPLDETKAAERIKKPLDEIKAAEGNKKSSDETKAAEGIKKPLDEIKAAEEIEKPLDEIKAAEEIKKPLDEIKAAEDTRKQPHKIKEAEDTTKPTEGNQADKEISKLKEDIKEEFLKPKDDDKEEEDGNKSEDIMNPIKENKIIEQVEGHNPTRYSSKQIETENIIKGSKADSPEKLNLHTEKSDLPIQASKAVQELPQTVNELQKTLPIESERSKPKSVSFIVAPLENQIDIETEKRISKTPLKHTSKIPVRSSKPPETEKFVVLYESRGAGLEGDSKKIRKSTVRSSKPPPPPPPPPKVPETEDTDLSSKASEPLSRSKSQPLRSSKPRGPEDVLSDSNLQIAIAGVLGDLLSSIVKRIHHKYKQAAWKKLDKTQISNMSKLDCIKLVIMPLWIKLVLRGAFEQFKLNGRQSIFAKIADSFDSKLVSPISDDDSPIEPIEQGNNFKDPDVLEEVNLPGTAVLSKNKGQSLRKSREISTVSQPPFQISPQQKASQPISGRISPNLIQTSNETAKIEPDKTNITNKEKEIRNLFILRAANLLSTILKKTIIKQEIKNSLEAIKNYEQNVKISQKVHRFAQILIKLSLKPHFDLILKSPKSTRANKTKTQRPRSQSSSKAKSSSLSKNVPIKLLTSNLRGQIKDNLSFAFQRILNFSSQNSPSQDRKSQSRPKIIDRRNTLIFEFLMQKTVQILQFRLKSSAFKYIQESSVFSSNYQKYKLGLRNGSEILSIASQPQSKYQKLKDELSFIKTSNNFHQKLLETLPTSISTPSIHSRKSSYFSPRVILPPPKDIHDYINDFIELSREKVEASYLSSPSSRMTSRMSSPTRRYY